MAEENSTPEPTYWRMHRYRCTECGNTGTVIAEADATVIVCFCGGIAEKTGGDEGE